VPNAVLARDLRNSEQPSTQVQKKDPYDDQLCCVRGRAGRPARPRTQHDCHHDKKVKPEAATAVIELLMMGGKTPETCLAINKRQDNKLENCYTRLVIYLN